MYISYIYGVCAFGMWVGHTINNNIKEAPAARWLQVRGRKSQGQRGKRGRC